MLLILFCFGACWSSFIATITWRYLINPSKNYSPLSSCDFCNQRLSLIALIPVAGFIIQRGHARCCHHRLEKFWPLAELVNGISWMAIPTTNLTELVIFLIGDSALLAICTEDWFTKRFSTLLLLPIGLLHWLSIAPPFMMVNLIGTVAFATAYLLPGIGNGDVDWIIICCLSLGPKITIPIVLVACLCSLLDPRIRQHRPVPFIPYLCLGLVIVLITNIVN